MAQLQNGRFQRSHIVYNLVGSRIDAIQSYAEPAHVHLSFGEMLYAGRVADVSQYVVWESILQSVCSLLV